MKSLAIAFMFISLFVYVKPAFASTISVEKSTVSYTESNTFSAECDDESDLVVFNPNGVILTGGVCHGTSVEFSSSVQGLDNWIVTPEVEGVYTLLLVEPDDACATSGYDGASDDLSNCLSLHPTPIATFTMSNGSEEPSEDSFISTAVQESISTTSALVTRTVSNHSGSLFLLFGGLVGTGLMAHFLRKLVGHTA